MKILLRPNYNKPISKETTINVVRYMNSINIEPLMFVEDYRIVADFCDCTVGSLSDVLKLCDVIMPIGGDGTVLNEVMNAVENNLPIIGINTGRIGFLTQLEVHELNRISQLKEGNYKTYERMLLEAVINKKGSDNSFYALNDIVLKRIGRDASLLELSIYNEEQLILRHRADGVIFSTPTGSTAYSFSAGGPVIIPNMEAITLTPICAYNTFAGSLVLPSTEKYRVAEEHINAPWSFSVAVDGNWIIDVEKGEDVIIKSYPKKIKMIDLGVRSFYDKLNNMNNRLF